MPAAIGWCSPIAVLPHACLPVRWWIRFAAAKPRWLKQPTGLFLKATFRIHNHLPPKQKKDIPFGMSFCFGGRWWIRTTEVIDDRFTVCSLWPLGKPSIFNYQLDWSWWTDLNPRPADYKSAALPTELHQHFSAPNNYTIIGGQSQEKNCVFKRFLRYYLQPPQHSLVSIVISRIFKLLSFINPSLSKSSSSCV